MALTLHRSIARWRWEVEEGIPAEIRRGRLLLSERPVWSEYPIPLYGIPDQVYEVAGSSLLVVDTKVRPRPAVSIRDAVQLSVYRAILTYTRHPLFKGRTTQPYGYLRFCWNGCVRYMRLQLYSVDAVMRLALAYLQAEQSVGRYRIT